MQSHYPPVTAITGERAEGEGEREGKGGKQPQMQQGGGVCGGGAVRGRSPGVGLFKKKFGRIPKRLSLPMQEVVRPYKPVHLMEEKTNASPSLGPLLTPNK